METLERAHAGGDLAALGLAAHTMKSSAGLLGARILSDHLRDLEEMARTNRMPDAAAVARARTLFEQTMVDLVATTE